MIDYAVYSNVFFFSILINLFGKQLNSVTILVRIYIVAWSEHRSTIFIYQLREILQAANAIDD